MWSFGPILIGLCFEASAAPPSEVVVHEWGTFTAVVGPEGTPIPWYPLSEPSDLPDFVHLWKPHGKDALGPTTIRMETPVVYVHSPTATTLDVRVAFTPAVLGAMTEWYPNAADDRNTLEWKILRVDPSDRRKLPNDHTNSHYYPARNVDAAMLTTPEGEFDKMLFYRGVASFDLPVRVTLNADGLTASGEVGRMLAVEKRGDHLAFAELIPNHATARPFHPGTQDGAEELLFDMLVSSGLYDDEARAMLDTWEHTWFEDGLRVLYVVPHDNVETWMPLTVTPAPKSLARVLIGRVEVLTPEIQADIRSLLHGGAPEQTASLFRAHYPRLAQPALQRLSQEGDPAAAAVLGLLQAFER